MSSGPTYYDYFGVSPSASPEQIRSAYLGLMKQHHPDLAGQHGPQRTADFAAILNRCYDVLKDPGKRASYDEFLAFQSRGRRKGSVRRRALLTGTLGRRRESRWDGASKGAALLACMILMMIGAAVWAPAGSALRDNEAATAASAYSPPQPQPGRLQPGPDSDALASLDLRTQVQLAMSATPDEAQSESEHCFALARNEASSARAEMCVVFDDAYLEWNQTNGNPEARAAYFDGSTVRLRHSQAMASAGLGQSRLDELRETALKALLDEIRAEMNSSAHARDDALADAQSPDFAAEMSR